MGFMIGLALLMVVLLCLLEWFAKSMTASAMPDLHLQIHSGELRLAASATGKLVSEGDSRLRQMGIWTVDLGGVDCHRTAAREGLLDGGATFHPISLAFDSSAARSEAGVVKVLAASPEIVRHLLRRQPGVLYDLDLAS